MDKIYRRPTQLGNTPKKKKNEKNRKRNTIINFRVSPEEKALIDNRISLSGLSRSEFFIQSCLYQKILVKGNIKSFEAIRKKLNTLYDELKRLVDASSVTEDDIESVRMVTEILDSYYNSVLCSLLREGRRE